MLNTSEWLFAKYREEEKRCRGPVMAVESVLNLAEARMWVLNGLMNRCKKDATLEESRSAALWSRICGMSTDIVRNASGAWEKVPAGPEQMQAIAIEFAMCDVQEQPSSSLAAE